MRHIYIRRLVLALGAVFLVLSALFAWVSNHWRDPGLNREGEIRTEEKWEHATLPDRTLQRFLVLSG